MELLYGTWHWFISGLLITAVMFVLIYLGKRFGMSSNLRTMCTMMGAKKHSAFFDFNWREHKWGLAVVVGIILGGFFAVRFLDNQTGVEISKESLALLDSLNIDHPQGKLVPDSIFGKEVVFTFKGFLILLIGGILVGFGARYAGGCTSGHAISGLSSLQLPSLIAVIGFFIGGLIMVHLILPFIF